jgi:hypothetical protein
MVVSPFLGETETRDKLRICAYGISEALALERELMTGRAFARYRLGRRTPHLDRGSTGQSPAAGPRGLNPPSVPLWVNQSWCLS